jgi:hypothetical protein
MLDFLIILRLLMLQLVVRFLVGNNPIPLVASRPNNSIGVAAAPYHIVPEVMKAAKNTATT